MITFGTVGATESLISKLPNLKVISCYGSGYEGIDLQACRKRGILVTNSPDANSSCVADMCMALILAVTRRIVTADRFVRTGVWNKSVSAALGLVPGNMFAKVGQPRGLGELKLGVLGLGAIGKKVAIRGAACEMEVGYHNRSKRDDVDPSYRYFETPHELASWCDVLAVCLRVSPSTRHIVDANLLTALGPGGIVVNISRGPAVDEKALVAFLKEGKLYGAGLDVFEREPVVEPELLQMGTDESGGGPYVVLAPHVGGATTRARDGMTASTLRNLDSFLRGDGVVTAVPEMA
ncbi:D-isomer specific 2-hydroxyacid dehydrogenase [Gonapodya prolifera JEL478]|uniref:D-isomer specific 2-hydroxyacid dehydrogenase n=1 Tax=Gonapodya prolifera (strain JEL478) TaxID=1344416 RepID=A0A139AVZ0_GONPJ|nr:D-isomer specific 2-hydroxyacid dehydrogenase [Gonapodya prolifera JEL478]|eukprot:KXS20911.1 D-isomer specific 2-hydroxyacid dehydrogenase [Gonapodya prolifera JEL478]